MVLQCKKCWPISIGVVNIFHKWAIVESREQNRSNLLWSAGQKFQNPHGARDDRPRICVHVYVERTNVDSLRCNQQSAGSSSPADRIRNTKASQTH